jgi:hypothetical protein
MMEWVYGLNKDSRLLNRLIEQSNSIIANRDDKIRKYKSMVSKDKAIYLKNWSHFRGVAMFNGEPVKRGYGIASMSTGINYPAATAITIAKHPEIWDNTYDGKTYKQIALEMLEYVYESWEYVLEKYLDPKTSLLLSPPFAQEPENFVPQWNRLFPLMAAGNILVDTDEILGLNDSRAKKIDITLKALFKHFWENSRIEEKNGHKLVIFPYGVYRLTTNPNHSEDVNHFGFDSRGFRVFSNSGRYWNEEQSKMIAHLASENVFKDDEGTVYSRISGVGETKNYDYWGALPPMIWVAEYSTELDDCMVKYIYNLMNESGSMDGRVVFHILHLRYTRYGIE